MSVHTIGTRFQSLTISHNGKIEKHLIQVPFKFYKKIFGVDKSAMIIHDHENPLTRVYACILRVLHSLLNYSETWL